MAVYAPRIAWYISGNDGKESFLGILYEDVEALSYYFRDLKILTVLKFLNQNNQALLRTK